MDRINFESAMWGDLFQSRLAARSAEEAQWARAKIYLEAGLPVERVCDALEVSRATLYRRLADLDDTRANRLSDARQRTIAEARETRDLIGDRLLLHFAFGDATWQGHGSEKAATLCDLPLSDLPNQYGDGWSSHRRDTTCPACKALMATWPAAQVAQVE
jgi:hypothetical protein